jgi:hypothetical protein
VDLGAGEDLQALSLAVLDIHTASEVLFQLPREMRRRQDDFNGQFTGSGILKKKLP